MTLPLNCPVLKRGPGWSLPSVSIPGRCPDVPDRFGQGENLRRETTIPRGGACVDSKLLALADKELRSRLIKLIGLRRLL
jgi:hypothetical protein